MHRYYAVLKLLGAVTGLFAGLAVSNKGTGKPGARFGGYISQKNRARRDLDWAGSRPAQMVSAVDMLSGSILLAVNNDIDSISTG